jgi:phenylalanyl-tRNA synthetase beta subunit
MWVPAETASADVASVLKEHAGSLCARIDLFDEFKKDSQVSYAFRLVFQSAEKTLTDDEVNDQMKAVYEAVDKKGWKVR